MKRLISIILIICSFQIYAQQTLIIGTLTFDAPLSTQGSTSGNFYGFEISVMNEICKQINAKCIYKAKIFDHFFTTIQNNQIDLAIGAIIITKSRKEKYLFSVPYFLSEGSFVIIKNKFKSLNDLNGKTIGTIKGEEYVNFIKRKFAPGTKIRTFPHSPDMMFSLTMGSIDAALVDQKPAEYWIAKDQNLQFLGPSFQFGNGYGIMASKSNQQLIDRINQVILKMSNDGTYLKIYKAYFE